MRRFALAACIVVAASAARAEGPGYAAPTIGPSLTPPDGTLVASGPTPALTLLYTGDVIGYVDPCG